MQTQSPLFFLIVCIGLADILEVNASYLSPSDPSTLLENSTVLRPGSNGLQNFAFTIISNDGPTVLGSKTVFNVTVIAPPGFYLSYTWGTFIPYIWREVKTYEYSQKLEVNWWKSIGKKTVFVYIDSLKTNGSKWNRITWNSSSVQVIDYLSINVSVHQNGKLISNGKVRTGLAELKAVVHDPHGFFQGLVITYVWILNDGTPAKVTTSSTIKYTFTKEGLFLLQISASLRKNGKLYEGKIEFYVSVKARLDGYILAWKKDDHHPTLPSKWKSLPLGPVHFQFHLVDKYSSFTGAIFSFVWDYGDGNVTAGQLNTTHDYNKLGQVNVVLKVTAEKNGIEYQGLIYKNISIKAPIKDLNVKSHSHLKKGTTVQFNITCRGSSPVSFCWYVTRGSCALPSDVICSPTRLYHHCRNTINHTFHHTGGYCVNVTVMNTVSFAEKSINIQVDGNDSSSGKSNVAIVVLPILAGLLLLFAFFFGIHYKMRHHRRLARRSEVATFDFRSSQNSLHTGQASCAPLIRFCPSLFECRRMCAVDYDTETEHELEEKRICPDEDGGPSTPQRKISYYGSIHRILGQYRERDGSFIIAEEDSSPVTPQKQLSKSV